MTKLSPKEVKAENARIDKKNAKIGKIKSRIGILGFLGIGVLLFSLLIGYSVDVKQRHKVSKNIKSELSSKELISRFVTTIPTILGEEIDEQQLVSDGLLIKAGGVDYKILVSYDLRINRIVYKVLSSEIGIKGTWNFDLSDTENGIHIEASEQSTTKNLGYRSSLFFNGEDQYIRNLLTGFDLAED